MPTISVPPIDITWQVVLASGTTYLSYGAALAAAVVLSAANSNAVVNIALVHMQVSSLGSTGLPQIDVPATGPNQAYTVGLDTQTDYYPQATAIVQAYALSASNSNAAVYVCQMVQNVTAP